MKTIGPLPVPFCMYAISDWLVLTWAAAIWTLRRLRFPLWWLLFPPIAEALCSANPQLVVLALLVTNRRWASAVATGLKVYAFIPLVGELPVMSPLLAVLLALPIARLAR